MADQPLRPINGDASRVRAEALGVPGSRRFRLLAILDGVTHVIWLEKQQLQALGIALDQVLEQLTGDGPRLGSAALPIEYDADSRFQFRAGRMELGFDEATDHLIVSAHDIEAEDAEDTPARLTARITRAQARDLVGEIETLVASGRPRCPLCSRPMEPTGHVCPQQNGHLPHDVDEDDLEVD